MERLKKPFLFSVSSDQLLQKPARPIPTRSPLATPEGVNRAGVEALVREIGSNCNWRFIPGSGQQTKRLTRFLRALTEELRHSEIQAGTHEPLGCILIDLPEPAPLK